MNRAKFEQLQELIEQRSVIEAETPGDDVKDPEAWKADKLHRLQAIDAQLSDLRSEAARERADYEKRG